MDISNQTTPNPDDGILLAKTNDKACFKSAIQRRIAQLKPIAIPKRKGNIKDR